MRWSMKISMSSLNEVASGNDDANSKEAEVVEIDTGEKLTMLDRLVNLE